MATVKATDLHDAGAVCDALHAAAALLRGHPGRRGSSVHVEPPGRLLVTGDLHDNPFHLQAVIRLARLDAGPDRHVLLQELIHGERLLNGMDFSHRMIVKVADLVRAYPTQVHPILANHEIAQLTRTGVSKGAGNATELFRDALDYAFGEDMDGVEAALDDFFRSMPLALRGGPGGVLCAHSLPAQRDLDPAGPSPFDPGVLDRDLVPGDFLRPHGDAYRMTWGRTWDAADAARLGEAWNASLLCLGHRHVPSGIETVGDRVVLLNSDHEQGRVLPVDLAALPHGPETPMLAIPLASVVETG